jgi:hypothetical protein
MTQLFSLNRSIHETMSPQFFFFPRVIAIAAKVPPCQFTPRMAIAGLCCRRFALFWSDACRSSPHARELPAWRRHRMPMRRICGRRRRQSIPSIQRYLHDGILCHHWSVRGVELLKRHWTTAPSDVIYVAEFLLLARMHRLRGVLN